MDFKNFKNPVKSLGDYGAGKKVVVMGLGLHGGGVGVAKFFAQQGAKVLVTDLRKKAELKESLKGLKKWPIKYVLGRHRSRDFKNQDLIIKNPAVPRESKYLQIARQNGVEIETDVGLFFELCPAPIIGITGTKGKSTTASLLTEILKSASGKKNVVLAGNIRASVLEQLPKVKKSSRVVLELSSWQLEGLAKHKKSPYLAVMTNIQPDHLNRYRSVADYIKAKKLIFKFQKPGDFLVLNFDNPVVKKLAKEAKGEVFFYSRKKRKNLKGAFVKNGEIYFSPRLDEVGLQPDEVGPGEKIISTSQIKLVGQHNIENVLAATTAAKILKVSSLNIRKAVSRFKGLDGRLEFVAKKKGISYYNDTTATIPQAAIAAVDSFPDPSKIILIAGGADKNLDFDNLIKVFSKIKALILLKGRATEKIKKAIRKKSKEIFFIETSSMKQAVRQAHQQAEKGDIILLSPGCASFGLFRHEFDRGEKFKSAVKAL